MKRLFNVLKLFFLIFLLNVPVKINKQKKSKHELRSEDRLYLEMAIHVGHCRLQKSCKHYEIRFEKKRLIFADYFNKCTCLNVTLKHIIYSQNIISDSIQSAQEQLCVIALQVYTLELTRKNHF